MGENLECQIVALLPSIAFPAGSPLCWSLATAVQPDEGSMATLGVNESAAVALSIGMRLPAMAIGPIMLVWPVVDIQEPDTYAKPEMVTKTASAAVQNLFTSTPELPRADPLRATWAREDGTISGRGHPGPPRCRGAADHGTSR